MRRGALFSWLVGSTVALACLAVCGRTGADQNPPPGQSPPSPLSTLRGRLDEVFTRPGLAGAKVGVEVVDCDTGDVIYARNPLEPLNPASNFKVLTSAVALQVLGSSFSFRTTLLRDGPFEDGVVKGNVYLRGEGDPEFVYEAVWKMVKDLQAQGLTTIDGDLVADDSYFDSERTIAQWTEEGEDDETHAYNAPLGALSVNFNTVALIVRPGPRVGAPVVVSLETPTQYVHITNRATTGKAKQGTTLSFSRASAGEHPELVLEGRMPIKSGFRRFYRTVLDPPRYALTMVSEMMAREGIILKGRLRTGKTPGDAIPLYYRYSSPLDILLKYMNKLSSNFIAEQIVKAMGARVYGAPGTTEKGLKVMRDYLQQAGLPWDDAAFYNGSGLSYRTHVSAHQLVSVLRSVHNDFKRRYDYLATFPIAGVDGTMRHRLIGTAAAGNLRAKTGSVKGVFGFSGYLQDRDGKLLAFSFLVNDIRGSVAQVKQSQDRWANLLMGGTGSPEPTETVAVPGDDSDQSEPAAGPEGDGQ